MDGWTLPVRVTADHPQFLCQSAMFLSHRSKILRREESEKELNNLYNEALAIDKKGPWKLVDTCTKVHLTDLLSFVEAKILSLSSQPHSFPTFVRSHVDMVLSKSASKRGMEKNQN